jgi:hypothetical protein
MMTLSGSTVLSLTDSIAIAIAQSYMLARARLASHPSPVLRAQAVTDHMEADAKLLERERFTQPPLPPPARSALP